MQSIAPRALTIVLALTLAAPLVAPADLNPAISLVVGAAGACVLLLVAARWGHATVRQSVVVSLGSVIALAAWLCVAALRSGNPAVSLMGTLAQHSGAALFMVLPAWAIAAALLAQRKTLREILGVVSVSGAAFAVMGIVEASTSGNRSWGSAAGPFENSSSLGAFLALAFFAAVAWWLSNRSVAGRLSALACGVLMLGGIAAAESRAGTAGLVIGLVVALILWLPPRMRTERRVLSFAFPAAALGATAVLISAAAGGSDSALGQLVAGMGTSRDAIWRSAIAQFSQSPLLGSGPEQFSAWVTWSFRDGLLQYNGTYDPHNLIMAIALGGGAVAVVLWVLSAGSIVWALLGVLERTGRPRALVVVVAAPAALVAATLFAWLTPAAAITAAALTGAMLATDVRPHDDEAHEAARIPLVRITAIALAVLMLATTALGVPMLSTEWRFARMPPNASPQAMADLYRGWADPSYASIAIERALATGTDAESVRTALAVPTAHVAWHVDLALRDVFLAQDALTRGTDGWDRFAAALEVGVNADPASAIWPFIGAAQANAEERVAERDEYVRRALDLRLGDDERVYLEGLHSR